jgi:hypothetical protein
MLSLDTDRNQLTYLLMVARFKKRRAYSNERHMNQPIVYAVIAMVCYGISDFIYKRVAAAGIRSDHFIMAQAWLLPCRHSLRRRDAEARV